MGFVFAFWWLLLDYLKKSYLTVYYVMNAIWGQCILRLNCNIQDCANHYYENER